MVARCATGVFFAVCGLVASAAEPTLTHVFPAAGTRGTTVTVRPSGKFAPWPVQVWVDAPGIVFKALPKAGEFDVEIAPDAAPGPHLIRLFNGEGASAPRFFIVSAEPEPLEAEPNDEFKKPQKIAALPTTISGQLGKAGDVDSFAIALKKGETLTARVEAYVLGSTFDGMLRLVDESGTQLAFNHDDGRTLDPRLTWTAPSDGTYVVQLMGFAYPATSAVGFTGGEGCIYRLHLTNGPFVNFTQPLAVERGTKSSVKLVGWNLNPASVEIDATKVATGVQTATLLPSGMFSDRPISVSDTPEVLEAEPNNTRDQAQRIDVPSGVTGCIGSSGDEDRFIFSAVKQRAYSFSIEAARVGSPLDGWLKIENKDGKDLARSDDAEGARDPRLTWTAPADGDFVVVVGDVTHRGGAEFIYRLAAVEAVPTVTATVANHAASAAAGKSAEVKVAVKRANGFKSKLQLVAKNLPEGVSAPDVDVPDKDGETTLKLNISEEAKPIGIPFQLALREVDSGKEYPVVFRLVTTGENNGVPQGYSELVIESTDQLWLTVLKRE